MAWGTTVAVDDPPLGLPSASILEEIVGIHGSRLLGTRHHRAAVVATCPQHSQGFSARIRVYSVDHFLLPEPRRFFD